LGLAHNISKNDVLEFGEYDFKPRAATEGRPYSTFHKPNTQAAIFCIKPASQSSARPLLVENTRWAEAPFLS
ncbi:MAG TPA: hypothetical protein VGD61_25595, partial [Pyrinomonadaceae bacterium]